MTIGFLAETAASLHLSPLFSSSEIDSARSLAGFFLPFHRGCLVYDVINLDVFDNKQMILPQSLDAAPAAGPRILVVEDNPDSLYLAAEILRTLGYGVNTAESGEQALLQLHAQPCDILFTDVSLPGMSGIDLARAAHAKFPLLRIIFATGHSDSLTRSLGFAARTIRKPYDLDQLLAVLSS
jgi:CheY-like chemotaxis protein